MVIHHNYHPPPQFKQIQQFIIPFFIGAILTFLYDEIVSSPTPSSSSNIPNQQQQYFSEITYGIEKTGKSRLPSFPVDEVRKDQEQQESYHDHHNNENGYQGQDLQPKQYDVSKMIPYKYHCAKWMKKESNQRKVLFVNFHDVLWRDFRTTQKKRNRNNVYKKNYNDNSVSMLTMMIETHFQKALTWNEFQIDYVHNKSYHNDSHSMDLKDINLESYHRIFYMIHSKEDIQKGSLYHHFFTQFQVLCRLRVIMNHDSSMKGLWKNDDNDDGSDFEKHVYGKLDKKQILFKYPDDKGTFLGSYLFDKIYKRNKRNKILKGSHMSNSRVGGRRIGLVKIDTLFSEFEEEYKKILAVLLGSNFTIHVICNDEIIDSNCNSFNYDGVILHDHTITPKEYVDIVTECVFTIGNISYHQIPTVWLDLAHGAAILDPIITNSKSHHTTKLFQRSKPYVYSFEISNVETALLAAEWAVENEFISYIPPDLRTGTMNDRVCALLEDDALCTCPNPTFEITQEMALTLYEKYGEASQNMDCRTNFLMKKSPVFSPLQSTALEGKV